jgi:hypothetical protein
MERRDKLAKKPDGQTKNEWDSHLYGDSVQYQAELGGEDEVDEREQ